MTEFSQVIAEHKSLKYLDVSANRIRNRAFSKLFTAVQSPNSKVSTFHCRKNYFGGQRIDEILYIRSRHLEVLDFSRNKLTEINGEILLKSVKANIFISKLILNKNIFVSANVINEVNEECFQNVLIKQRILS